jgi:uncharacterized protein YecE (DUF72 family)
MYKASRLADVPGTPDALDALATINRADIDGFKAGIEPLASAGKLGALLAQFPPSFKQTPEALAYLEWLLRVFRNYRVAVELRHNSWSDRLDDTLAVLDAFGAAYTQIDEPKFRTSIRQNWLPNVESFYYVRLHGRNAKQWWTHDSTEDRYNYLYSEDELKPFAETAVAARALVKKAYLYMNNHFAAKSIANAVQVKHLTGDPISGAYPPAMVEAYPALRGWLTIGEPQPAAPEAEPVTASLLDRPTRRTRRS